MEVPTTRWKAEFFDGVTPRAHPVAVLIHPDALVLQREDGSVERWIWAELRLLQGLEPGEHVRLSKGANPTAPALVIRRSGFLDAVHRVAPQAKLGRSKSHFQLGRAALLAFAGSLLVAFGVYHWGIPALANRVTEYVPTAWETALGAEVVSEYKFEEKACPVQDKQRLLNQLFAKVKSNSQSPYPYRVLLVHGTQINALAAPGGHVVVFESLVTTMPSAQALAGVLAHEMQHVERRHGTRALLREMSSQLLLAAMVGDAGALGQLLGLGTTLDSLAYGRADEREADRLGLQQLIRAGLDPRGMVAGFQALAHTRVVPDELEKKLNWASTHPAISDRLRDVAALARDHRGQYEAALNEQEWKILAQSCKASSKKRNRSKRSNP
jgi:predicted Zn-dependent protease